MALPAAVQRQVEAAEALLNGANQPAVEPPAEPQAQPEPQQEPTAAAPVSAPEPSPAPQQPNEWEQKYKVLQGKFNSEVPALHHQVKDLSRKLQEQAERTEALLRQQETKQAEQRPTADPKDVDAFGADLVEMVQRVAQQMLGNTAAKIDGFMGNVEKRIVLLEQRLQGTTETVAQTAQETFYVQLERMVPDWQAINADQRFLVWLGEDDPLSGRSRQAALDAASGALDVRRTAAIFRAFLDTLPKQPPKANTAVNKQVSPSSVAAAAPVQTEAPSFTEAEVSELYARNRRKEFTPKQWEQIEQSINTAMAMGRIRSR